MRVLANIILIIIAFMLCPFVAYFFVIGSFYAIIFIDKLFS